MYIILLGIPQTECSLELNWRPGQEIIHHIRATTDRNLLVNLYFFFLSSIADLSWYKIPTFT
jgi:hypothetical protein